MRGIDIFCVSQAATAIRLTMDDDASSSSSSSAVHLGGSRLIDRHNPIISDPKRNSIPKSSPPDSPRTKSTPSNPKNDKNKKETGTKEQKKVKKKKSGTSDFVWKSSGTISCAKGGGFISPAGSSRYLLGESTGLLGERTGLLGESASVSGKRTGFLGERTGLLEVFPDFDPVPALVPDDKFMRLSRGVSSESTKSEKTEIVKKVEDPGLNSNRASSSRSSDQVVVLRVSLHCKGCAGKVRKHISRMQGVTSFNIDFAAKKVTVVGDVTPLGVLASISKVKTAQLWTPPNPKPSSLPEPTSTHSEIRKNKGIVV